MNVATDGAHRNRIRVDVLQAVFAFGFDGKSSSGIEDIAVLVLQLAGAESRAEVAIGIHNIDVGTFTRMGVVLIVRQNALVLRSKGVVSRRCIVGYPTDVDHLLVACNHVVAGNDVHVEVARFGVNALQLVERSGPQSLTGVTVHHEHQDVAVVTGPYGKVDGLDGVARIARKHIAIEESTEAITGETVLFQGAGLEEGHQFAVLDFVTIDLVTDFRARTLAGSARQVIRLVQRKGGGLQRLAIQQRLAFLQLLLCPSRHFFLLA